MEQASALRRKTAIFKAEEKEPLTAARALRAAVMRLAQATPGLVLEVGRVEERRLSLAELLDLLETPAFIAILAGPQEALGMATLSPGLMAALIEARMTGRLSPVEPSARRTTPTDAMLASRFLDAVMDDAATALASEPDVTWTGGYRYASYLDDSRPLGLMLEEGSYRLIRLHLQLSGGGRAGQLLVALPAAGRGAPPLPRPEPVAPARLRSNWSEDLGQAVSAAPVRLDAVVGRVDLPLSVVAHLAPGMLIPLPGASIGRIALTALDGRVIGDGRLGQAQGFRAIRLSAPVDPEV